MRICHISDIQVRLFKRHEEFRKSFDNLYKSVARKHVDHIVIAGDCFHNKSQISAEQIDLGIDFFNNLSNIAPLHLIAGNHDAVLNNLSRLDPLSPIIKALKNPNIFYYKNSGVYNIKNSDFDFVVFSCFDNDWPTSEHINPYKINVGLFHGMIQGAILQNDQEVKDSPYQLKQFLDIVDYLMLGDIHKTQILDMEYRAAYCGSLIQQNYGEGIDKGYLLWTINGKKDHEVDFVKLPNVCPFYTLTLSDNLQLPNKLDYQKKARIRVFSRQLNIFEKKSLTDKINSLYDPHELVFIDDSNVQRKEIKISLSNDKIEDLTNVSVQEKLIKEYLKDHSLSDNIMSKVFGINKIYNAQARAEDDTFRNIQYKLGKMHFYNTFSYGEDNIFDFSKYKGIVGIFGKNAVGKALDLKVEIPSIEGWKTVESVQVGDFIFGADGKPTQIIAKSPVYRNRVCYEVEFSDGEKVICDGDHLWTVEDHFSRIKHLNLYQTVTTRNLSKLIKWKKREDNVNNAYEWSIDVAKAIEYVSQHDENFLIHPYVLGCWLGDGTSSNSHITTEDSEILENLRQCGEKVIDCEYKDNLFCISGLQPRLRKLGVLNNKHIPRKYLETNIENRRALLAGLLDTDGYCGKERPTIEFCNTNKLLADQVCELVCSLGFKATVREGDATLYGKFISKKYRVCFTTNQEVFWLKRKRLNEGMQVKKHVQKRFIKNVKKVTRRNVQCLVVDNSSHLFLITRKFIPTHNSSLAVDVPLYCLFNKISKKGVVKNDLIINENKEDCGTELEISVGRDKYIVRRVTHVYSKSGKKQNDPIFQGKTDVEFEVHREDGTIENRSGEERSVTDANIRKTFGSLEDFVATSMAPQWQLLGIIDAGGTNRQKLIGRYFDIDIFAQKYKLANEEWKLIKGQLKVFQDRNFEQELLDINEEIEQIKKNISEKENDKGESDKLLLDLDKQIESLRSEVIASIQRRDVSLEQLDKDIEFQKKEIIKLKTTQKEIVVLTNKKNSFNIKDLENKKLRWREVSELESRARTLEEGCPCEHREDCPLHIKIRDIRKRAISIKNTLDMSEKEVLEKIKEHSDIKIPENVDTYIQWAEGTLEDYEEKKREFLKNEKQAEKNEQLLVKINGLKNKRHPHQALASSLNIELMDLSLKLGQKNAVLEEILESKRKYEEIKNEYEVYHHFLSAMSKDGIVKKIIADNLDIINIEIKKILSKGVNFSIELASEDDGKAIEIYFQHEKSKQRRIELCSGMERTIAAIAIRAALINVTTLPRSNVFVLDEVFTALDPEYMEAVNKILEYLKQLFDSVIIITHIDSFKDLVDNVVEIGRDDEGYSRICQ